MARGARWLAALVAGLLMAVSHAGRAEVADTTPPQFCSEPEAASVGETSLMLRLAMNEAGMTYFSILPAGSLAPSSREVRAGAANNSITEGTINAPAPRLVVSADIEELPVSKHRALDIYLVAEDAFGNLADPPHRLPVDLADYTEPSFPKGYPKLVSLGAEFANVNLGLDEPGFVYYLLQRASHASVGEPIDPAVIKECAMCNSSCPVESFASAGKLTIGEPAVGKHLPYDGDNLFASYRVPYTPGNYWLHFAAEDDEEKPNLMRKRNVVRRKLASVQPPTWSDKGPDPFYVPALADDNDPTKGYTVYDDPGITAYNPSEAQDITEDVIMTHNVDTSMPGTYTVNYEVTYFDTDNNQYVTGYESRTVIVTGPWAPAYKGNNNGVNDKEGNNPGSCCEWYRTCRLEDFLWDCTQDVIDGCKSTDIDAKCIICLQLDKWVKAGWGYMKYTKTKPDPSLLGRDAVFIGNTDRVDEMERMKAMGNLPGLMGPSQPGYLSDPVHPLEKGNGRPQRADTVEALKKGHNWKKRLSEERLDLLSSHNVRHRRMLAAYDGYESPTNVRFRNSHRITSVKGDQPHVFRRPKFSVCRAVRYQCTAVQDNGSGKCLPVDDSLRPWDYQKNHATFTKNEVRSNILQKHLDEKVKHSDPLWQK
eukprot:jgi/Tetstr1/422107/TSEL_012964.t1